MTFHLITCCTENKGYFSALQESAKRNGFDLKVLGWGKKWTGFTFKITHIKEYIKTLPDSDIVLFVDAYDVLIIKPKHVIKQRFLNTGAKILIGKDGERLNIFHDMLYRKIFKSCKSKFINAGVYIGFVKELKEMFDNICNKTGCNETDDDQKLLIDFCNSNEKNPYFVIDGTKSIIYNTFKCVLDDVNLDTCILHAPGNANLSNIIKKNGYSLEIRDVRPMHKYLLNNVKNYYKFFIKEILLLFAIFLVVFLYQKVKY